MKGILGRKSGMTTIFTEEGKALPITVIEVQPNIVLESKTKETNGYVATKLGSYDKKENKATKPEIGIAKKAKTTPKYFISEIRNMTGFSQGDKILADIFEVGEYVDITATSKGKGFTGSIKRHNFSRGPMGHGSKYHRGSGSRGTISEHVWKGKKSPGHMGHEKVTMQNLVVIDIDLDNNLLLVKGSIPGPNKSFVVIKDSIKKETSKAIEKLVNVEELQIKNELLEEAKKVGANINSSMSVNEMKQHIKDAEVKKDKLEKEHKILLEKAEKLNISKASSLSIDELRETVQKAEETSSAPKKESEAVDNKEEKGEKNG